MRQHLTASEGRICLSLQWKYVGNDLLVILEGGDSHLGAVVLCQSDGTSMPPLVLPHHREGQLAQSIAVRLASALHVSVCVSAGIHYDNITQAEISTVLSLADMLAGECLDHLSMYRKG